MSKIVLSLVTVLTISIVMLSCGEDESIAPQLTAPEVRSISPTTGTVGTEVILTIRGIGFTETTVTSDYDYLVLTDTLSSDTEIEVTATISDRAFPKIVNLILTNSEGTDSVSFSLVPASLEGLVWSTVQDIPTPRWGLSVVAVDDKIYAIGGVVEGDSVVATMEIFDPSTNTWTTGVDMPTAVLLPASAVIDGKIYIAGGINWKITFSTLNVFDPSTDTWTSLTDMPSPRHSAGGAGFDGKFYVAGGANSFFLADDLWSYDVATSTWTSLAKMPRLKASFGMVANDDRIYAIGGESENNPWISLYFTPSVNSWTTTTAMPTPRRGLTTDNFLGNVITIGGRSSVFTATVESLNPTTDSWSTLADLPDAKDRGGVAVIGDKIYVVGGRRNNRGSSSLPASTFVGEIP